MPERHADHPAWQQPSMMRSDRANGEDGQFGSARLTCTRSLPGNSPTEFHLGHLCKRRANTRPTSDSVVHMITPCRSQRSVMMVSLRMRSARRSNGRTPQSETTLPCHLADQAPCFHPSQIALHSGTASSGQGLCHRSRGQWPFRENLAQNDRRATRQLRHRAFRAISPCFYTIEMTHRSQNGAVHAIQPAVQPL